MKKLAIIGTAVAALAGPLAQSAWAMPADVTPVVQSQSVAPLPAAVLEQGSTQRFAVQPTFGPTKAEQRAETLRSEALNQKYRLGTYKIGPSLYEQRADMLRGQALNRKYGLGTFKIGPTKAELRADTLRGEALNQQYGLGVSSTSSSDFQWGDAGIGAGALLGIVALIGAGLFEVRQHGRLGTS
ncbi:MAG TPA: hypothetical protein VFK62_06840 [Gaiellaceae bacterium]|nr:hypothetical protein [Gaiellaceae bacterium]